MRINIDALMARAYAVTYPWAHKFIMERRLQGSGLWMAWRGGYLPAANEMWW